MEHQDWEAIYAFASFMKDKWHDQPVKEDTEFQTMWNVAHKEGKIQGLTDFIEALERAALDHD